MQATSGCGAAVAVGAPHEARGDLGEELVCGDAEPRGPHDVEALRADVVEVQRRHLVVPAVRAAAGLEDVEREREVPGHRGREALDRRARVRGHPPRAGADRRAETVAVRAHDLASCDLRLDALGRPPVADKIGDIRLLAREMVELEDGRITLPTIHARCAGKAAGAVPASPGEPAGRRRPAKAPVVVAMLAMVGAEAAAAVVLTARTEAVE